MAAIFGLWPSTNNLFPCPHRRMAGLWSNVQPGWTCARCCGQRVIGTVKPKTERLECGSECPAGSESLENGRIPADLPAFAFSIATAGCYCVQFEPEHAPARTSLSPPSCRDNMNPETPCLTDLPGQARSEQAPRGVFRKLSNSQNKTAAGLQSFGSCGSRTASYNGYKG